MIKEVFAKIDKLQLELDEIYKKQDKLYATLELDSYSQEDIFLTIKESKDSLCRLFLADYFRERFKMTLQEYALQRNP